MFKYLLINSNVRTCLYYYVLYNNSQGMDIIETLNPTMFTDYLKKYGNTICGRHPISVLLQVIAFIYLNSKYIFTFIKKMSNIDVFSSLLYIHISLQYLELMISLINFI